LAGESINIVKKLNMHLIILSFAVYLQNRFVFVCRHDSTMQDIVYKLLPHVQEGQL